MNIKSLSSIILSFTIAIVPVTTDASAAASQIDSKQEEIKLLQQKYDYAMEIKGHMDTAVTNFTKATASFNIVQSSRRTPNSSVVRKEKAGHLKQLNTELSEATKSIYAVISYTKTILPPEAMTEVVEAYHKIKGTILNFETTKNLKNIKDVLEAVEAAIKPAKSVCEAAASEIEPKYKERKMLETKFEYATEAQKHADVAEANYITAADSLKLVQNSTITTDSSEVEKVRLDCLKQQIKKNLIEAVRSIFVAISLTKDILPPEATSAAEKASDKIKRVIHDDPMTRSLEKTKAMIDVVGEAVVPVREAAEAALNEVFRQRYVLRQQYSNEGLWFVDVQ